MQARLEETKMRSPMAQKDGTPISISETILLKYKRATDLCQFYEEKYQG